MATLRFRREQFCNFASPSRSKSSCFSLTIRHMPSPRGHYFASAVARSAFAFALAIFLGIGASLEAGKSAWEIMSERPTYAPAPVVPPEASAKHLAGTGVFTLYIWSDGTVRQVQVTRSTGHAILDKAAVETLSKWRYGPGSPDHIAVPVKFDGK